MFETLIEKLQNGPYVTLETTPSHSATFRPILDKLEALDVVKHYDGFTTTDNPLAKLKFAAIPAAIQLQQKFGKPVIATVSMRDKNIIALQSDLLGANDFDIRTFLVVTGDPAKLSDQPHAKGVFQGNSVKLLEIIKFFNAGIDYAGKKFAVAPKPIYPFAVSNSHAKNMATLKKKLHQKVENGAVGIVTQPVYDLENAKALLELFNEVTESFDDERRNAQLIFGLFPLTRLKTARFLDAHVPGIYVPEEWTSQLFAANKTGEEEEHKVGMEMSRKLMKELMELHPKVHVMTANKFEVAKELVE